MAKKRLHRCAEASFLLGIALLGCATALMARAGFGLSMVVAPAYVLADWLGFLSSGTACYICQGLLVLAACLIVGRFRVSYLFTFLSAVLFGAMVDVFTLVFAFIRDPVLWQRVVIFAVALPLNTLSIALLFHTYFPPQAPELFVKELAGHFGWKLYRVKYIYDLASCALSVALSLLLLGKLRYIGAGTFVCALLNGPLIAFFGRRMERLADFEPLFPKIGRYFAEQ